MLSRKNAVGGHDPASTYLLWQLLRSTKSWRRYWSRKTVLFGLGLLLCSYLDRDYTHRTYSDASYGGLGGWSADFSFLWRLTRDTLVEADFEMREIKIPSNDPAYTNGFLHINPLEYLGALIKIKIRNETTRKHAELANLPA